MGETIKVRKIGKYFLKEKLGEGAMGSVWLSFHSGLNVPVAIKLLNMDLAAESPDYLSRFMKEGQLAVQLNHKNIVRVYDAGMEGNSAFIAMEFIEGCDTLELVNTRGALPPDEVLALAIGVGDALQEAHSLGIIHRDIKPDNILATTEGRIKLADLGLAKQVSDDFGSTMAGTALGTPYYISPEQALNAVQADERSDIYSLGATLYHLLSGFLPYEGDNAMGVMLRHANEPLVPPQKKKPDLPESFCKVICKMMEKDPLNRYQNCSELLEDLHKLKYGNNNVAQNSEELLHQSEKELTQALATSKSVRVKMKIPNKGKYAHREGIITKRNLKKRTVAKVSKKKNKNNVALPAVVVTTIILFAVVLIPSLFQTDSVKTDNIVDSAEVPATNNIIHSAEFSETENIILKPKEDRPIIDLKSPENKKDTTGKDGERINLLAEGGKKYFKFISPRYVSFINGNLIFKGERAVPRGLILTKEEYSNYRIELEYQWLDIDSDTGIIFHLTTAMEPHYEINLANSLTTGSLHGKARGTWVNNNGQRSRYLKVEDEVAPEMNKWHRLELICKDDSISFMLNDKDLYRVEGLNSSAGRIKMNLSRKLHIEIRKFDLILLD